MDDDRKIKTVAIITAKGGNLSVQNKNVIPVLGVPVMAYPIRAAKLAKSIDRVYVCTEDSSIAYIAEQENVHVLQRPDELSRPESQHRDVIKFSVEELKQKYPDLEDVVILLGNTVMVTPGLIDRCVAMLHTEDCDSCLSAWEAQDDHPYRALCTDEAGHIRSFLDATENSNRQSYPQILFYDQGVWAFKYQCAIEQRGPKPWVWLGQKCRVVKRPWVTGRDIHTWIDVMASVWYLSAIQAMDFGDYEDKDL